MAFPEFCWYTVVSKPCTLRTTYYPFGPRMWYQIYQIFQIYLITVTSSLLTITYTTQFEQHSFITVQNIQSPSCQLSSNVLAAVTLSVYFLLCAELVTLCLYGDSLEYWFRVSSPFTEGPSTGGRTNGHWLGRDETNWGESGAALSVHALLILVLKVYWKNRNCIFFHLPSLQNSLAILISLDCFWMSMRKLRFCL